MAAAVVRFVNLECWCFHDGKHSSQVKRKFMLKSDQGMLIMLCILLNSIYNLKITIFIEII